VKKAERLQDTASGVDSPEKNRGRIEKGQKDAPAGSQLRHSVLHEMGRTKALWIIIVDTTQSVYVCDLKMRRTQKVTAVVTPELR
jgi:hypothetical protein